MKTLTTLRSHCLKGIKLNFPKMYKMSKHCPLNCDNKEAQCEDTQTHMLKCKKLDGETKVNIDNMYSVNVMEQAKIAKVFTKLKKKREQILEDLDKSLQCLPGALFLDPSIQLHQQKGAASILISK